MAVPAADATDTILGGRYWLETVIGEGGMATVYRARDETLGRQVAIKLFHGSATESSRAESELAVLASMNHHGLINLFDAGVDTAGTDRPHRYLVMELVKGIDLRTRLQQGPLSPRHIAEIGFDLAEALEYIHLNRVVHRDIKPSNVLLVDYGDNAPRARAKLSDFGIALTDEVERFTRDGTTTGTAAYLSPEQAAGAKVGKSSDVYSLGLVLLECFTRKVEFSGTLVESAIARLSRDPVIPADLPDNWRQVLSAMTARKPSDRPGRRDLVAMLKQLVIDENGRHKDAVAFIGNSEAARVDAVKSFEILNTLPDIALDRVTAMAARLFSAPVAIVSVIDDERVWFKSHYGVDIEHMDRDAGSWATAVPDDAPLVIEDATVDPRADAMRVGYPQMRFFAGVPLKSSDGFTIGSLCVIDTAPRTVTPQEIDNLGDLAALVMTQLELRREGMRVTGELRQLTGEFQRALPSDG